MIRININILKAERTKYGLTQKDMAKELGKSVSSYCKREIGLVDYNVSEIRIIKRILKLSPSKIDEIFFND